MKRKSRLTPMQLIALGFAAAILLGALLLLLPFATYPGKHLNPLEALFTSTSAVCVTGLIVVDTGTTFTAFGKTVIALLIQLGGLGIAVAGIAVTIALGRGFSFKERSIIKESWNIDSYGGLKRIFRRVLQLTLVIELLGAAATFPILLRDYPPEKALPMSLFHSISAFNNAGFDLFGGYQSLTAYRGDAAMNLVTAALIVVAGVGYLTLMDVFSFRSPRRWSLQTKVSLFMTGSLLIAGTLLLKLTDGYNWLEAFFQSVTARTAGFNTVDLGAMSEAGLFVMVLLMIVGACPGSTGGGTKTTTWFAMFLAVREIATGLKPEAFRRRLPARVLHRAFAVVFVSLGVLCVSTFLISVLEPEYRLSQILFEVASAVNTVGVTTGITSRLGTASRVVLILTMYFGRLGPLSVASLWGSGTDRPFGYSEESITVG